MMITKLLNAMLHFAIGTFWLSGALLWMRRRRNERSRQCLAIPFFLVGAALLLRLLASFAGLPPSPRVLPIVNLYGGLIVLLLLYLYPAEVISPGWLTFRKGIILFAPVWLLTLLLCMPFHFRELCSFGDLTGYIGEINVWFRLLILLMCIVPYSLLLFYIPYNWRRSSANYNWISVYTIGIQGIGVLFTLFMLTGSGLISIMHIAYCILFCLFITYRELFLRIEVPLEQKSVAKAEPLPPVSDKAAGNEKENSGLLWKRLEEILERGQPWQNPNFTLDDLAALLAVDRTALSLLLRRHGYATFKDFINRYRIGEFLKLARSGRVTCIQDSFFQIGFRSRVTVLRYFKEYTGTTPTEYLRGCSGHKEPVLRRENRAITDNS